VIVIIKSIKKTLGNLYRASKSLFVYSSVLAVKALFRDQLKMITLEFWSDKADDGSGAQIQRNLTIRVLANFLGCNFNFSKFKSIAVHPLDPFQTKASLDQYLIKLNKIFYMRSSNNNEHFGKEIEIINITLKHLLRSCLSVKIRKKPMLIRTLSPYSISESIPNLMFDSIKYVPEFEKFKKQLDFPKFDAGMHYRQGVGGFAVYPGQKISRQLPLQYFLNVIESLVNSRKIKLFSVAVFTDSPIKRMEYSPPKNQLSLWAETPSFVNQKMHVIPNDFSLLTKNKNLSSNIFYGGDPIVTIAQMASIDILIIGRSSLSYVAGILSKGSVIYPTNFWHKPLKNWIPGDKLIFMDGQY